MSQLMHEKTEINAHNEDKLCINTGFNQKFVKIWWEWWIFLMFSFGFQLFLRFNFFWISQEENLIIKLFSSNNKLALVTGELKRGENSSIMTENRIPILIRKTLASSVFFLETFSSAFKGSFLIKIWKMTMSSCCFSYSLVNKIFGSYIWQMDRGSLVSQNILSTFEDVPSLFFFQFFSVIAKSGLQLFNS